MAGKKQERVGRTEHVFGLFKDHEADWAVKRTLEYMGEQAAEIGEVLSVVKRIDPHDAESWTTEWARLAERLKRDAESALSAGRSVSARELYLRACNMFRTAEYGTTPSHPMFHHLWRKSVDAFQEACALYEPVVEPVVVPFEGRELPGYFWRAAPDGETRPTLFAAGGNDSSIEEVFFLIGPAAFRRGYNFFTFDFPGHRGAVHLYDDMVRRPDFETPFSAAFDALEQLPGVDERIALTGFSGGGGFVIRVALHEHRIAALIPNSPLIDMVEAGMKMWRSLLKMPGKLLDTMMARRMAKSPVRKAFYEYSRWVMPYRDMPLKEYAQRVLEEMSVDYNYRDQLSTITCPTLALVSENEGTILVEQAKEYQRKVSSAVNDLRILTLERDGTDDHIQLDNRSRGSQLTFDWLDGLWGSQQPPRSGTVSQSTDEAL